MTSISVVIPARNAASFVAEALDSVFAQGLKNPEVVVVDDGSTDDTVDVVRRYGRGVRLLTQPASGSARARNTGLTATTGELVAFLDADDVWTVDKLTLQLELLERDSRLSLVFSDMDSFESSDRAALFGPTYFKQRGFDGRCTLSLIFLYDMVSTPTVILRRRCLDQVGGFDETLPIGQDTDLWFRIALAFPFAAVDKPLVQRRFHPTNTTRDHRLLARCVVEVWGRYLQACIEREPEMRSLLLEDFARKKRHHLFVEGCSLLHEGHPREARRCLGQAIGVAPFHLRPYAFYLASFFARTEKERASLPEGP